MKKAFLILLFLFPFVAFGQAVIPQGDSSTLNINRGGYQVKNFIKFPELQQPWYGRWSDIIRQGNLLYWFDPSDSSYNKIVSEDSIIANAKNIGNSDLTLTNTDEYGIRRLNLDDGEFEGYNHTLFIGTPDDDPTNSGNWGTPNIYSEYTENGYLLLGKYADPGDTTNGYSNGLFLKGYGHNNYLRMSLNDYDYQTKLSGNGLELESQDEIKIHNTSSGDTLLMDDGLTYKNGSYGLLGIGSGQGTAKIYGGGPGVQIYSGTPTSGGGSIDIKSAPDDQGGGIIALSTGQYGAPIEVHPGNSAYFEVSNFSSANYKFLMNPKLGFVFNIDSSKNLIVDTTNSMVFGNQTNGESYPHFHIVLDTTNNYIHLDTLNFSVGLENGNQFTLDSSGGRINTALSGKPATVDSQYVTLGQLHDSTSNIPTFLNTRHINLGSTDRIITMNLDSSAAIAPYFSITLNNEVDSETNVLYNSGITIDPNDGGEGVGLWHKSSYEAADGIYMSDGWWDGDYLGKGLNIHFGGGGYAHLLTDSLTTDRNIQMPDGDGQLALQTIDSTFSETISSGEISGDSVIINIGKTPLQGKHLMVFVEGQKLKVSTVTTSGTNIYINNSTSSFPVEEGDYIEVLYTYKP